MGDRSDPVTPARPTPWRIGPCVPARTRSDAAASWRGLFPAVRTGHPGRSGMRSRMRAPRAAARPVASDLVAGGREHGVRERSEFTSSIMPGPHATRLAQTSPPTMVDRPGRVAHATGRAGRGDASGSDGRTRGGLRDKAARHSVGHDPAVEKFSVGTNGEFSVGTNNGVRRPLTRSPCRAGLTWKPAMHDHSIRTACPVRVTTATTDPLSRESVS